MVRESITQTEENENKKRQSKCDRLLNWIRSYIFFLTERQRPHQREDYLHTLQRTDTLTFHVIFLLPSFPSLFFSFNSISHSSLSTFHIHHFQHCAFLENFNYSDPVVLTKVCDFLFFLRFQLCYS